ncbi:hypothetical protein A3D11_03205 [Candidatus Peribacteria bacterium RIFCSPHIGHO2_02_FULL_49_16]|nr:MAG: hypothetical protein A3D11_03205 [Candidatus Peribacteria bacterium RIFCSPHIGHO2_02_FULL_49_16]
MVMTVAWISLFVLLGLIFGSFGTVIVMRVPKGKGIGGRSRCVSCSKKLSVRELIPVFSFLLQRGTCLHCKKRIHWLYPFIECATVLLFLTAFWFTESSYDQLSLFVFRSFFLALLLWLLLLIAIIDLHTQMIPDTLNIPLLLGSIFYTSFFGDLDVLALILGGGFFGLQWILSRGKWVGSGDIILGTSIGALLGSWRLTIYWIAVSYCIGAAVVCYFLATGKKTRKDRIAFGPFLVVALWMVMVMEKIFDSLRV